MNAVRNITIATLLFAFSFFLTGAEADDPDFEFRFDVAPQTPVNTSESPNKSGCVFFVVRGLTNKMSGIVENVF